MLQSLAIQNIVLIDDLHVDFKAGLCVLTGETGGGKSILLDALGLALGARADTRLLRQGASKAHVTASFALPSPHPLWRELEEQGIACEENEIIFRRLLEADGKSKCFINDQMVSQTLLKRLGQNLVEIHGQFDQLLDPKSHLAALDSYGKIVKGPLLEAFHAYQTAKEFLKVFQQSLTQSSERLGFLTFAIEEIEKIAPKEGEEQALENDRSLIAHRAKLAETLFAVDRNLEQALSPLSESYKALCRIQDRLPEKVKPLTEALDLTIIESQEVWESIKTLHEEVQGTPQSLETLENRLYSLRGLSRKYQTDDLVACLAEFKKEISVLGQGEDHLEALEKAVQMAKNEYLGKAREVSETRKKAASALQTAIAQEFPPLKLNHATFRVHFKNVTEDSWSSSGIDHVEFYIQTNPGLPEGPLSAIASGGELSRLMLALKVALAQSGMVPTLIFDEIESGTGGAVASAMGERLKTLSQHTQILAITHSPQIAAYGTQHFVVFKSVKEGKTTTYVKALNPDEKCEEVARMLAGEEITKEARAAAKRLMEGEEWKQA